MKYVLGGIVAILAAAVFMVIITAPQWFVMM